ncbi:hypothetical protein J6590_058615 [Homalodisca vitripennis]|nr:hypothetical protein J6590_058615 [Homalodisca vitripennis]
MLQRRCATIMVQLCGHINRPEMSDVIREHWRRVRLELGDDIYLPPSATFSSTPLTARQTFNFQVTRFTSFYATSLSTSLTVIQQQVTKALRLAKIHTVLRLKSYSTKTCKEEAIKKIIDFKWDDYKNIMKERSSIFSKMGTTQPHQPSAEALFQLSCYLRFPVQAKLGQAIYLLSYFDVIAQLICFYYQVINPTCLDPYSCNNVSIVGWRTIISLLHTPIPNNGLREVHA